ncbi:MAG: chitobiase/beta-hexosaminidase C-terminal domain-containing protein [Thermoleophilaceae bacterium]|nr:chitobiase/beta-hexosaminidase C-terminal domain-containing protein [Thermoleophilaceae bacterium]
MKFLGPRLARALLLACVSLFVFSAAASAADYEEGFESLATNGWSVADLSATPGDGAWAQGDEEHRGSLTAHSGAVDSFVVGYPNIGDNGEQASEWLISPKFSTLSNGDLVRFQMRANYIWWNIAPSLELRLASGDECSPGTTAESVGDFTNLLLTLNPGKYSGPYTIAEFMSHSIHPPWAEQGAYISGLPDGEHSGCLAIRYKSYVGFPMLGIDDFALEERASAPTPVKFLDNFWKGNDEHAPFPLVRGIAERGTTVSVYNSSDCSGTPLDAVSSDEFDWPGVHVYANEENVPFTISAKSTNATGEESGCTDEGVEFVWDTIAPTTTDDVGDGTTEYPGPAKLSAEDSGAGVLRTYYTVGVDPETPTASSSIYNSASPPTIRPGEKISYFSVDKANNAEAVKTSQTAPFPKEPEAEGTVKQSSSDGRSVVRPASRSLHFSRGRIAITLICDGAPNAASCTGSVSVRGSTRLTSRTSNYSIPVGSSVTVKVTFRDSARRLLAKARGRSPWVRVLVKPTSGSAQKTSFRRKLRL